MVKNSPAPPKIALSQPKIRLVCGKEFACPNLKNRLVCVERVCLPQPINSPRVCVEGVCLPQPKKLPRGNLAHRVDLEWRRWWRAGANPHKDTEPDWTFFTTRRTFFHRPAHTHTHTHALGGLGNSVFGNVYLMICAFASLYRSRGPSSRISHLQQQQQKQAAWRAGPSPVLVDLVSLSLSLSLSRF